MTMISRQSLLIPTKQARVAVRSRIVGGHRRQRGPDPLQLSFAAVVCQASGGSLLALPATMMHELPQAVISRVVWTADVYEPSDDSFALVDAVLAWMQQELGQTQAQPHAMLPIQTCLEVGCGSGYVICSVALALQHTKQATGSPRPAATAGNIGQRQGPSCTATGCSFVATDINPAALQATAATLQAHGVHNVELVQTDLVAGLLPRLAGAVDLLLFNPPYVPTPDEEVERDGIARAWAGGHLGRRVTDRLLPQLPELLSPTGHAFIVTVPENKPQEILGLLAQAGLRGEVALTRAADEESLQILHVWRGA